MIAVIATCFITTAGLAGCQGNDHVAGQNSDKSVEPVAIPARDVPAELAAKMRSHLAGLDKLTVESKQRVSYLYLDDLTAAELAAPERDVIRAMQLHADKVVTVDVRIRAEMTPDSFTVTVWRGDEQRPIAVNSLALRDGVPFITERQWHPILGDYRQVSYPSPYPHGYDDATVPSVLFEDIDSSVCATAEFFHTWLGESDQADSFEHIITKAIILPNPAAEAATDSTRLHREVYKGEEENDYSSRDQYFVLSSEPPLLLEWNDEFAAFYTDTAVLKYMTVERTYRYPTALGECELSSGVGSKHSSDKENDQ